MKWERDIEIPTHYKQRLMNLCPCVSSMPNYSIPLDTMQSSVRKRKSSCKFSAWCQYVWHFILPVYTVPFRRLPRNWAYWAMTTTALSLTTPSGSVVGLQICPLSEERRLQAEKELRETPERVKEALAKLRELLKADTTIKFREDDEFLLRFLRPTKFYPESAYSLLQRVAEFKEKNHELLGTLRPVTEKTVFIDHNVVNVMAGRDQKGRRVMFVNLGGTWNTKAVTADQIFRLFYLIHQGAMMEPESQVAGVVVVMDFLDLSMRQVTAFTPAFSMRLLTFIQDAMPLRLKEVHIVNQPFIFKMVFTMFKPFIREKLRSRMFFHGKDMESLHKHLEPEFLPKEYNGKLPAMDYSSKDWYQILEALDDKVQEWNSMGLVDKKQSK